MKTSDQKRSAIALAALAFGMLAPVTYHLIRIYERLRNGPADASMIISEARTTFYWRFSIATWWAGLIAWMVYRLVSERSFTRTATLIPLFLLLAPLLGWLAYRFP